MEIEELINNLDDIIIYDHYFQKELKDEEAAIMHKSERQNGEPMDHIQAFLGMIIDPIPEKPFNRTNDAFGVTYAKAFEVFASALLGEMDQLKTFQVNGQANDQGADIIAKDKNGKIVEVCQVKLGSYFQSGKGNAIVLQLVGTCFLFGVTRGIIFSNEPRNSLKEPTMVILREVARKGINITTMFREDIEIELEKKELEKAFIINHINSKLPIKNPNELVSYEINCACGKTFKFLKKWSLRTDIYWHQRAERDNDPNSVIVQHRQQGCDRNIDWINPLNKLMKEEESSLENTSVFNP